MKGLCIDRCEVSGDTDNRVSPGNGRQGMKVFTFYSSAVILCIILFFNFKTVFSLA